MCVHKALLRAVLHQQDQAAAEAAITIAVPAAADRQAAAITEAEHRLPIAVHPALAVGLAQAAGAQEAVQVQVDAAQAVATARAVAIVQVAAVRVAVEEDNFRAFTLF